MTEEIEVTSINVLLDKTRGLDLTEWIYRGVSDCQYKLSPSIGRARHESIAKEIGSKEEQQALWRFRDKVRPYIGLDVENELEWMVIAQHHGVPTRLLDWTRSPIVAAYFAATKIEDRLVCSKGKVTNTPIDGGIYAVKRPPKVGSFDREKPFNIDRVKLIDPPHISERVPRQVSVLTIHPRPQEAWEPNGSILFIIPKKFKFKMKKELDRLGTNQESLFPGIDATAAYLSWQLKWNRLTR